MRAALKHGQKTIIFLGCFLGLIALMSLIGLGRAVAAEPQFKTSQVIDKSRYEQYQKQSEAYAAFTFNQLCLRDYEYYLTPIKRPPFYQKPNVAVELPKACECYTREIMSKIPATDIIQSLTFMYGYQSNRFVAQQNQKILSNSRTAEKVMNFMDDPANRKKCGFKR